MDLIKNYYSLISTLFFVLTIVVAHLFSTNNYDWTKNTISDLGSQGYDRRLIMQLGFLGFGLTLSLGILSKGLTWLTTPILIYGLCIALTGIFCTKPFFELQTYSATQSNLHSLFAQITGISFSVGILTQILFAPDRQSKTIHLLFFLIVITLSATFGMMKNYEGIFQRILYLISFLWLIKYYKH